MVSHTCSSSCWRDPGIICIGCGVSFRVPRCCFQQARIEGLLCAKHQGVYRQITLLPFTGLRIQTLPLKAPVSPEALFLALSASLRMGKRIRVQPSFLKRAFLHLRQQDPVARKGEGGCETISTFPPSLPCASSKHSLGPVTPRWPICGQGPEDTLSLR